MTEPTNTKRREAVPVSKAPLDMHQRKQGELPKDSKLRAPKEGEESMDLADVDNNNADVLNTKPIKKGQETYKNFDFDKAHDDFAPTVVSKKEKNAGA